jgi:hypothetical protein
MAAELWWVGVLVAGVVVGVSVLVSLPLSLLRAAPY